MGSLDANNLPEEPEMREKLVTELLGYQAYLESDSQPYLVAGTSRLTAADAAVYAQLERLVGDEGDVDLPNALPELLEEQRLARLWRWHQSMRSKHPIKFKGKRPSGE